MFELVQAQGHEQAYPRAVIDANRSGRRLWRSGSF